MKLGCRAAVVVYDVQTCALHRNVTDGASDSLKKDWLLIEYTDKADISPIGQFFLFSICC